MRMRLISIVLVAALELFGQGVTITSLTDISGSSATVQLSASGSARWIQFIAPTANMSVVRIGDSNIGTTRGAAVAPGGGFMMPVIVSPSEPAGATRYSLSGIYYYVATGDKLSVIWAN
jgi:hypothetical protein